MHVKSGKSLKRDRNENVKSNYRYIFALRRFLILRLSPKRSVAIYFFLLPAQLFFLQHFKHKITLKFIYRTSKRVQIQSVRKILPDYKVCFKFSDSLSSLLETTKKTIKTHVNEGIRQYFPNTLLDLRWQLNLCYISFQF